jgi:hypothetical protein
MARGQAGSQALSLHLEEHSETDARLEHSNGSPSSASPWKSESSPLPGMQQTWASSLSCWRTAAVLENEAAGARSIEKLRFLGQTVVTDVDTFSELLVQRRSEHPA